MLFINEFKIHKFKQLQPIAKLGLPEFDTTNDKDPFDLKFKRERLHISKSFTCPYMCFVCVYVSMCTSVFLFVFMYMYVCAIVFVQRFVLIDI